MSSAVSCGKGMFELGCQATMTLTSHSVTAKKHTRAWEIFVFHGFQSLCTNVMDYACTIGKPI